MKNARVYILPLILLLIGGVYFSQNKELAKSQVKQKKLEKEIKDLQVILKNTKSESNASLGKILALTEIVSKRKLYINSIQDDVTELQTTLLDSEELIEALESDVDSLKRDYAEMIYSTSKMNHSFNRLFLIFSSASYNHLAMRLKFLNQFAEIKREQVEKIGKVQSVLGTEKNIVSQRYTEKKRALDKILSEKEKLNSELASVTKERANLKSKEKQLKKEISDKEKEKRRIKKIISELMKGPTNTQLSKSFAANKGKLPWPVRSKKFVSWKYGRRPHPTLRGIELNNLGIGIQTTAGASVYSSFEGEVRKVMSVPGKGKMVMIKHGDYFTMYGQLKNISVKPGSVVRTGDKIGEVMTTNGTNTIDFQVWYKRKNQNPQLWLVK